MSTKTLGIIVWYDGRDGGWYRVMRDGNCVQDFRDPKCAGSYARALRKERRAILAKGAKP